MEKKLLKVIIPLMVFISMIYSTQAFYPYENQLHKIQTNTMNYVNILQIETITGGKGIMAEIRNNGAFTITNISWRIHIDGGFVIVGKEISGFQPLLRSDQSFTITLPLVIGLGKTTVTVTAIAEDTESVNKTARVQLKGFRTSILPGDIEAISISIEKIAGGFRSPTVLTHAGDNSNRLFVADLTGKIFIIENEELQRTPFIDISEKIVTLNPIYDERGLLGLVFHPDYKNNGRFFVYYSAPSTTQGVDNIGTLAEYHVSSNSNIADEESEVIIYQTNEPEANHNGGQLAFGPDGYLYIGLGDGGGAGDQHNTIGNGQNINTPLGAILRIDVNHGTPYSIPPDNPFVGVNGLDEIYAYGFRNPYRFSFDELSGRLFVADVGQDKWEEIDIVKRGGNYGWRIMEGDHLYDPELADTLEINPEQLEPPIYEYSHAVGHSVIGGFVYRGNTVPELSGMYVFADWSDSFTSPGGRIYYLRETEPDNWIRAEFQLSQDKPLNRYVLALGQDQYGELYVLTTKFIGSLFRSGEIWKISNV